MAITRTAQNAARTARFESFGIKPSLDSFESYGFFTFVLHDHVDQNWLRYKLYSLKTLTQQTCTLDSGVLIELAQQGGEFFLLRFIDGGKNCGNAFLE